LVKAGLGDMAKEKITTRLNNLRCQVLRLAEPSLGDRSSVALTVAARRISTTGTQGGTHSLA
jgi:hypothetical protein